MNTGFSLILALIAGAHALILIEVVLNHRKREICICGHRFALPKIGQYICSNCGKKHFIG